MRQGSIASSDCTHWNPHMRRDAHAHSLQPASGQQQDHMSTPHSINIMVYSRKYHLISPQLYFRYFYIDSTADSHGTSGWAHLSKMHPAEQNEMPLLLTFSPFSDPTLIQNTSVGALGVQTPPQSKTHKYALSTKHALFVRSDP